MRDLARSGLALAGAIAVLALSAWPANAHDELIGSIPEDGATVAAAPAVVELVFDQPVQREFSQVAVLDDSDGHHEVGDPEIVGGRVRQPVDDLPAGAFRVSYRIVSADGHPVSGTVTFTVAEGADDTPTTAAATPEITSGAGSEHDHHEADATATAEEDDAGANPLLLTAGGVAAVGVLGAVVYFAMGGRRAGATPPDEEAETAP